MAESGTTPKTRLYSLLQGSDSPRLLVVGDLILDGYLRGRVGRISPEAPVPVVESVETDEVLGGAANVANNLIALGCAVALCGVVGDDANGAQLRDLIAERGIDTAGVLTLKDRPTTHKLRVVTQGQQLLRIDREERAILDDDTLSRLLHAALAHIPKVDGVVVSDYRKGVISGDFIQPLIEAANAAGIPVVVDPKGVDYTSYRGAPNKTELQDATGIAVSDTASIGRAVDLLRQRVEVDAVLVTCGSEGMVLYEKAQPPRRISAESREVYDVTGAGDTVAAALALGLARGATLSDAAQLANTAAGLVVSKFGTATVGASELAHHVAAGSVSAKILDRRMLAEISAHARASGKTVVFTNGCFDLLHAGHVNYLQSARGFGDVLIVGLNSDASVARLKGDGKPIIKQEDRAIVLAALGAVSYVTIFDEDDPEALIDMLRPDVLVKGADYHADEVVGRAAVEANGGRLELVALTETPSTSALIDTIVTRFQK